MVSKFYFNLQMLVWSTILSPDQIYTQKHFKHLRIFDFALCGSYLI